MKATILALVALLIAPAALAQNASSPDFSNKENARYTELTEEELALLVPGEGASEAVVRGYEIYQAKCDMCHGAFYQKGGTLRLEDRYQGDVPGVLALRTDLSGEVIENFVRTNTPGMPPFRITEIDEEGMADIIAYMTRLNPDE